MTGWMSHHDLPAALAAMAVAIAPCPNSPDFYVSPAKLFGYLASWRAIGARRTGQINERVRNDENGILVEPVNVEELQGESCFQH